MFFGTSKAKAALNCSNTVIENGNTVCSEKKDRATCTSAICSNYAISKTASNASSTISVLFLQKSTNLKRAAFLMLLIALMTFFVFSLSACGEQIAATWAHGEIQESDITTRIENMRSSNSSTGSTSWDDYIKGRSYNSDATDEEKEKKDGTVDDMRNYVITELIKNKAVINEADEKGYTVSDDELNSYVEEKRTEYVSTYASGMSGTFESILRQMGYKSVSAFKEASIDTLKERKVQEAITGKNDTADDFDEDAWKNHKQELYDNSDVHINSKPDNLSYDPDSSSYEADTSTSTSTDTSSDTSTDTSSSTDTSDTFTKVDSDSSSTDSSSSGTESTNTDSNTNSTDNNTNNTNSTNTDNNNNNNTNSGQ